MLCEICHKKIVMQRHIFNLFDVSIHHICETCYMKYPTYPKFHVIPIEKAQMYVHIISDFNHRVEPLAYMSFIKPAYINYLKHFSNTIILYFDILDDNIMSILDSLELGDLYVTSLYENIEEKGE